MIERDRDREISFVCDTCGTIHESRTDNFSEAFSLAKLEGWRAFQVAGEWAHACPRCNNQRKESVK